MQATVWTEQRAHTLSQLANGSSVPMATASAADNTINTSTAEVLWVPAYWPSFIEHPDSQQSTKVGVWLRLVLLPVILLAGFFGNGLTLTLMTRPRVRSHSYSPYLTALALSDSLALLVRLAFWINLLALTLQSPPLFTFRSHGACAVVEYVCTANHVLCSWLVVCLTYERLVVVVLPLKSARFVSASNSVKVVVVMLGLSGLVTCYVPAVVYWVPDSGGCVVPFPLELFAHFASATTFVSLLPLLLICCGNLVIVIVLFLQSRKRAKLLAWPAPSVTKIATKQKESAPNLEKERSTDSGNYGGRETKSAQYDQRKTGQVSKKTTDKENTNSSSINDQQIRQVTFTLLCVSLAFLILVMPNALLVFVLGLRPDWSELQALLDPLALLWDANFAINFYLYVFAGKGFRAEVSKMLRCS